MSTAPRGRSGPARNQSGTGSSRNPRSARASCRGEGGTSSETRHGTHPGDERRFRQDERCPAPSGQGELARAGAARHPFAQRHLDVAMGMRDDRDDVVDRDLAAAHGFRRSTFEQRRFLERSRRGHGATTGR
jgi:hypothetical protein